VFHKRLSLTALSVAIAGALATFATCARSASLDDMQADLEALRAKVADLEKAQRAAADGPSNVVTGGATKGSFKLPGSNTSVTLGGYVKLDAIFSNPSAGVGSSADQELEAGNIPVGPAAKNNERNQFKLHARQSRLFAGTSTPSAWGEVSTYVEGDFFGAAGNETASNSNGFRVRHAYGTLGGLLAGQTWTTFADVTAYPETLDFGGAVGVPFARQAQIRWTQSFANGQWSIALENPETVVSLANGTQFRADDDRMPDVAGIVRFGSGRAKYSIAGIVRQLRVDSASAPASQQQKVGGALGVNGVVPFLARDDVRFSAYYGNAIGRYSTGFLSDAVLDANGNIALPKQWMATVAVRHFWTPTLRSTLALSGVGSSNPDGTAGAVNKSAESVHANLIWSPVERTNLGVEYIFARREIQNGDTGNLNRLQVSAQYSF
jgi:DcaP outer membrane protein